MVTNISVAHLYQKVELCLGESLLNYYVLATDTIQFFACFIYACLYMTKNHYYLRDKGCYHVHCSIHSMYILFLLGYYLRIGICKEMRHPRFIHAEGLQ